MPASSTAWHLYQSFRLVSSQSESMPGASTSAGLEKVGYLRAQLPLRMRGLVEPTFSPDLPCPLILPRWRQAGWSPTSPARAASARKCQQKQLSRTQPISQQHITLAGDGQRSGGKSDSSWLSKVNGQCLLPSHAARPLGNQISQLHETMRWVMDAHTRWAIRVGVRTFRSTDGAVAGCRRPCTSGSPAGDSAAGHHNYLPHRFKIVLKKSFHFGLVATILRSHKAANRVLCIVPLRTPTATAVLCGAPPRANTCDTRAHTPSRTSTSADFEI
jgi:hypothetical protein